MNRELWTMLLMMALGTTAPLTHLALFIRTARVHKLSSFRPWAALALPPATPVIGWLAGARWLAAGWCLQVAAYLVLWSQA